MLTVLDLFSGIGGFSLGLERTCGFKTACFVEVNEFCQKVLSKNWPGVPIIADITREFPSSAAASLAKISAMPGEAPALPAAVRDSGGTWWKPFAWFDRATSSWRTWQRCLERGWALYSATWPRSVMTRNAIAYQREPLVPLTFETASGLWPTPTVLMTGENRTLEQFDAAKARALIKQKGRTGNGIGEDLAIAVKRRMWPTPIKRDGRSFLGAQRSPNSLGSEPLVTQAGGKLNPPWVAWLMGYPLNWTDGVSVQSKRTATPSSPKSPNSSAGRSSKRKRAAPLHPNTPPQEHRR